MSYSFNVRASTKAEAKSKIAAELEKIAVSQPSHAADRAQAQAAAEAFVDVLAEDADRDVQVAVNGWLSWSESGVFTSACVGVTASLVNREA